MEEIGNRYSWDHRRLRAKLFFVYIVGQSDEHDPVSNLIYDKYKDVIVPPIERVTFYPVMRVDIVRYDSFDPTSPPATLLHDLRDLIEGIVLPEPRDQYCTEFTLDPNIHRVYGVKYTSHLGAKIKAYCTSHAAVQAINDAGVNCARILGGIRGIGWRLKYSKQYKHGSYLTIGRVRTGVPELDNVRGRPDEPESGAYGTAYPTSGSTPI